MNVLQTDNITKDSFLPIFFVSMFKSNQKFNVFHKFFSNTLHFNISSLEWLNYFLIYISFFIHLLLIPFGNDMVMACVCVCGPFVHKCCLIRLSSFFFLFLSHSLIVHWLAGPTVDRFNFPFTHILFLFHFILNIELYYTIVPQFDFALRPNSILKFSFQNLISPTTFCLAELGHIFKSWFSMVLFIISTFQMNDSILCYVQKHIRAPLIAI